MTGGNDGSIIVWQVQPADPPVDAVSGATFEITVIHVRAITTLVRASARDSCFVMCVEPCALAGGGRV